MASLEVYLVAKGDSYGLFSKDYAPQNGVLGLIKKYVCHDDPVSAIFSDAKKSDGIIVSYPSSLDYDHVERLYAGIVDREIRKNARSLAVRTTLTAATLPLPVPFITILFAYLATRSYARMENARLALEKAEFVANGDCSGLEGLLR